LTDADGEQSVGNFKNGKFKRSGGWW